MTPVHPQMSTDGKGGFHNQDLVSEHYFLGCCFTDGIYTTKVRHNSLTIESKVGCCCPITSDVLIPYSAIQDVQVVYGGGKAGSFRQIFVKTMANVWSPHSTYVKGADAVAYLMGTIQAAMDSSTSYLSLPLQAVVGKDLESRPIVTKLLWDYIKANNLQDPRDRRVIRNDEKMLSVFKKKRMTMFEMNKLISDHLSDASDLTFKYENSAAIDDDNAIDDAIDDNDDVDDDVDNDNVAGDEDDDSNDHVNEEVPAVLNE